MMVPITYLYRVEIHNGGDTTHNKNNITCKWSQDNAKYVYKIIDIDDTSNTLTVLRQIQDRAHNLQPGDWIEVTDDRHELWRLPGVMVKILEVKSSTGDFVIQYSQNDISFNNKDKYYFSSENKNILNNINFKSEFNPIIKKWNYYGKINNTNITTDLTKEDKEQKIAGTLILENGIYINFSNGFYENGDYWLIPARVFKKEIEWPKDNANSKIPRYCKPIGPIHHHTPIALIEYDKAAEKKEICDIEKILENKDKNVERRDV